MHHGMIQIGKNAIIILLVFLFISCNFIDKRNLVGIYTGVNYTKTVDTLIIREDGSFLQLIYDRKDGRLIHRHDGTWEYSDNYIHLDSFLVNLDQEFSPNVPTWDDVLMHAYLPVKQKLNGEIKIMVGEYVYLRKIKNR